MSLRSGAKTGEYTSISFSNKTGQEKKHQRQGLTWLPVLITAPEAGMFFLSFVPLIRQKLDSVFVSLFGEKNHDDLLGRFAKLSFSLDSLELGIFVTRFIFDRKEWVTLLLT